MCKQCRLTSEQRINERVKLFTNHWLTSLPVNNKYTGNKPRVFMTENIKIMYFVFVFEFVVVIVLFMNGYER